jgi:ubiquinone/menaquinone biosynthesis C-methylase UbiE
MQKDTNCSASDFYNEIAGEYDQMFDFKNDLAVAEKFVAGLKERFDFNNVLDIGCGTGSLTLALARTGANCVGMDLSSGMIEKARKNTAECAGRIKLINCGIGDMRKHLSDKFDLIICIGNTIPHLLDTSDLDKMFADCSQLLSPGGHLAVNLLNYDRVLDAKDRIVGITRDNDIEFIRFYDFEKPFVNFNLLEINWSEAPPVHKLVTTKLYPFRLQELESALVKADFKDLVAFEGMAFKEYSIEKSKSVMFIASKV